MKGQANSETDKLGNRSEWLERGVWFAGGLVVAGLLMEYGPDLGIALARHEAPKPVTIGGLLVTIGVAAEVILGIFVAKTARRLQVIAETTIAETLERAAKAEETAAEANLARVKLERQIADRDISVEESDVMVKSLQPFAGQAAEIEVSSVTFEAFKFLLAVLTTLDKAGWHAKYIAPPSPSEPRPQLPFSGTAVQTTADEASLQAGKALSEAMSVIRGSGICALIPGLLQNTEPVVRLTIGERHGISGAENSVIFEAALRDVTPPQA